MLVSSVCQLQNVLAVAITVELKINDGSRRARCVLVSNCVIAQYFRERVPRALERNRARCTVTAPLVATEAPWFLPHPQRSLRLHFASQLHFTHTFTPQVERNTVTYTGVIDACARGGELQKARCS